MEIEGIEERLGTVEQQIAKLEPTWSRATELAGQTASVTFR
jgi:hypothetical protein